MIPPRSIRVVLVLSSSYMFIYTVTHWRFDSEPPGRGLFTTLFLGGKYM